MSAPRRPLDALLRVATDAAKQAGATAHAGFRKHPAAERKGDNDFVTAYDRASEDVLRRCLEPTGVPFVGEETGGDRSAGIDGEAFYVDPIDGTTNFLHGHPFYAVSIGMVARGVPVLGVVYAPALDCLWTACVGGGATRNGEVCAVSATTRFGDALLATGFPYDRATNPDNNFARFVAVKTRCRAVRRCGSASLDLCLVADGTYDGYWESRLKPWDLAGGAALVLAAGGRVSGFDGGPADVLEGNLVATNARVHDELLGVLRSSNGAPDAFR